MWPAHRAAQQQARTVQETDGETGFSTGGAETGSSLIEPESQTYWMKEREEGGVITVRFGDRQIKYITRIKAERKLHCSEERKVEHNKRGFKGTEKHQGKMFYLLEGNKII